MSVRKIMRRCGGEARKTASQPGCMEESEKYRGRAGNKEKREKPLEASHGGMRSEKNVSVNNQSRTEPAARARPSTLLI